MPPAPLTASLIAGILSILGLVHLAVDPEPFDQDRALLIGGGMALLTLVVIAGLLLARGRWGRWSAAGLGAGWALITARADLDSLAWSIVVLGAALLGVTVGPWLSRWLRRRPTPDGPPPAAVGVLLSLLALPVVIGLSVSSIEGVEWIVASWAIALAFGISRASAPSLWAGRLFHPGFMVAAAWSAGLPAAIWLAGIGLVQTTALWRRDILLAVSPLLPETATTVPIPPELVDPAILRAAGLDDRGTPLEGE